MITESSKYCDAINLYYYYHYYPQNCGVKQADGLGGGGGVSHLERQLHQTEKFAEVFKNFNNMDDKDLYI